MEAEIQSLILIIFLEVSLLSDLNKNVTETDVKMPTAAKVIGKKMGASASFSLMASALIKVKPINIEAVIAKMNESNKSEPVPVTLSAFLPTSFATDAGFNKEPSRIPSSSFTIEASAKSADFANIPPPIREK